MIPLLVQRDRRLLDGAKILYGEIKRLEFKHEGMISVNISELSRAINKNDRQTRKLINQLVEAGWLLKEKTVFTGPNQYTLITPEDIIYRELSDFLSVSKTFKQLKLQDVLTKFNGAKLLRTLEALEWTYRDSTRPVEKPLALIRKAMRTGVTLDAGFESGWWKERIVREKKRAASRRKAKAEEKALAAERDQIESWYQSLPAKERDRLREEAINELRTNGGLPKFGKEPTIKNKMWELEGKT